MTKSPDAFRTISEVAEELGLPQHVLRFWETRFSQLKPMKRGGGRRYYRPHDVELLRGVQHLLYDEGYTIKGVQRILKENGNRYVIAAGRGEDLAGFVSDNQASGPRPVEAPNGSGQETAPGQIEEANAHPAKQAVAVSDIMRGEENSSKGNRLFNRLVGKDPNGAAQNSNNKAAFNLSNNDKQLLQSTLYDLLECKRLLDQAR